MKRSNLAIITGLLFVPVLVFGALFTPIIPNASAAVCEDGTTVADGAECANSGTVTCLFGPDCAFTKITNAALYIIGAVSVLMLIYGGIRYTASGGNEKNVTAAKNTILYAIVGIVVAVLAFAIVNFVLTALAP